MTRPNPSANPSTAPYEVLGIDPKGGPDKFVSKQDIKSQAKQLIESNKHDKQRYRKFSKALKEIQRSHPEKSSNGTWRVPLKIDVKSPPLAVQTESTVIVTDFLGDPVERAQVRRPNEKPLGRTNSNGEATIRLTETGSVELIAKKSQQGNIGYAEAKETVSVEKQQIGLEFGQCPQKCSSGDEVSIRIVDGSDNPKKGVEVSPQNGLGTETDADGKANVEVTSIGNTKLYATKSDDNYFEYDDAETTIEVKKREVSLEFGQLPNSTTVGKKIRLQVLGEDDDGVEDAEVSIGGTSKLTSESGWVILEVPPQAAETATIVASKPDATGLKYADADAKLKVDERKIKLSFAKSPEEGTIGKDTEFRIIDDQDNPVPGVNIICGNKRGHTNKDGFVTVTFAPDDIGETTLKTQKQGRQGIQYQAATTSVNVSKQSIELNIDVLTDSTEVNTPISFKVKTDDGIPVDAATIHHRLLSDETNSHGQGALEFDSIGSKTVIVNKPDTPTKTFRGDRTEISVSRQEVTLNLSAPSNRIDVYQPIEFKITSADGTPVYGVNLTGDDTDSDTTDNSGKAELMFTETGEKEVTATKPMTSTVEFVDGKTTVTVAKRQVDLSVGTIPDQCTTGDTISVEILGADATPENDVVVRPPAGRSDTTEQNGIAKPEIRAVGETNLTANKRNTDYVQYKGAETTIEVEKQDVHIEFEECPTESTVGNREHFKIVNSESKGVKNVQIEVADVEATTSAKGSAVLELPAKAVGTTKAIASKKDTDRSAFDRATERISVKEREVDLQFSVAPDETTVGENTRVQVTNSENKSMEGVAIIAGGKRVETGSNGYATLIFTPSDLGKTPIKARKKGPKGIVYHSAHSDIQVKKQQVELQIQLQSKAVEIYKPVKFEIISQDDIVIKHAVVKHKSLSANADSNGEAVLEFESIGRKTIIARKQDTPSTEFQSASRDIEVKRQQTELVLSPPDGKIEAHQPVTFAVKDSKGRKIGDANVTGESADGGTTNRHGETNITFSETGKKQVSVSKPPSDEVRYTHDSITVTVNEPPKSVFINDISTNVSVGDDVNVEVVDQKGAPLQQVFVRAISNQAQHNMYTDSNGVARFTPSAAGFYQISASKDGYDVYDEDQLRVSE